MTTKLLARIDADGLSGSLARATTQPIRVNPRQNSLSLPP